MCQGVMKTLWNKIKTIVDRSSGIVGIILIIIFIVLTIRHILNIDSNAASLTSFKDVQYVKNYDGDTITVNLPGVNDFFGREIAVRVLGVDTPEIQGACESEKALAIKARDYVHKRLSRARRIDLVDISKGKYFRIVARVMVFGRGRSSRSLSTGLLRMGYAKPYDGKTKKPNWCKGKNGSN